MTCLVVREGRPIGVNNFPVEKTWLGYEAAHKAAIDSAIDCVDQDEALGFIATGHHNSLIYQGSLAVGARPGVYPIPGLSFKVVDGGHPMGEVELVAILSLEQSPNSAAPVYNLSPCPFCGSEPEWINEALADSHFYIRCPHCQIVMREDRRDKVIGMWNRRSAAVPKGEGGELKIYTAAEAKKLAIDFFYHWWNQPGNNTEEGFDTWIITRKKDQ